jgi:hypothetical protein
MKNVINTATSNMRCESVVSFPAQGLTQSIPFNMNILQVGFIMRNIFALYLQGVMGEREKNFLL